MVRCIAEPLAHTTHAIEQSTITVEVPCFTEMV